MRIKIISQFFRIIYEEVENKSFRDSPQLVKIKKDKNYQYYGYNTGGKYTYDKNKPNLKKCLLENLRNHLSSDDEFNSIIESLKGKGFNGKNISDKYAQTRKENVITIDSIYLKIYLIYIFPELDFHNTYKEFIENAIIKFLKEKKIDLEVAKKQRQSIEGNIKLKRNNLKYYACYYTKDGVEIRSFLIIINLDDMNVTVQNTHSKRIYKGSYSTFDNHSSLYVKTKSHVCIHMIIYTGRSIEGQILFGLMTLIDNKGNAISTNNVLVSLPNSQINRIDQNLEVQKFLLRGSTLRIDRLVERLESMNEFENVMLSNYNFESIEGFYSAYIVSKKRKIVVTFAIHIDRNGKLKSWRKASSSNSIIKSTGTVYNNRNKVFIIDINIDPKKGKSFSEYRLILDSSENKKKKFGFLTGVYSGLSVDYSNPRGGRICFIPEQVKSLNEITLRNYKIGEEEYFKLIEKYQMIDKFFIADDEEDHLIESAKTFTN